MGAKHTAGPWTACFMLDGKTPIGFHISPAEHGSTKPICETRFTRDPHEGMEANAHLIAAAPDLLEALEAARSEIYDSNRSVGPAMVAMSAVMMKIDAAIAKAEGRS